MEITEQKENALFNRKEIKGFMETEKTPSRSELIKIISENLSVPAENIKIKSIKGKFGSKKFNIEANIYSSEKDKNEVEIKKKKELEAEKKAEEEKSRIQEESNNQKEIAENKNESVDSPK